MNNKHHSGRLSLKANLSYEPPPLLASLCSLAFCLARLLSELCPPRLASSHPPTPLGGRLRPLRPLQCVRAPVCTSSAPPPLFAAGSPPLPDSLSRYVRTGRKVQREALDSSVCVCVRVRYHSLPVVQSMIDRSNALAIIGDGAESSKYRSALIHTLAREQGLNNHKAQSPGAPAPK